MKGTENEKRRFNIINDYNNKYSINNYNDNKLFII